MELCKTLHWFGLIASVCFLPFLNAQSSSNQGSPHHINPVYFGRNTNPLSAQLKRIARQQETEECPDEQISFEMVTGKDILHVFDKMI